MTSERLEEFCVLAGIQNYSKAAEKLFISQSVLSRHVLELERELGVTLFIRNTHHVRLTDEGRYFLQWIRPLLEKIEKAERLFTGEYEQGEKTLLIHYSEQTLNTQVLSFLHGFKEKYPEIHLKLRPVTARAKKEMFYAADLLLSPVDYTSIALRDIESTWLFSQEALLAIPPFSKLGDRQEIHLCEIGDEILVVPFADDLFGPYARNALLVSRRNNRPIHRIEADSPEEALLKVELGEGSALIPHHLRHRVYPHTRTIPVSDPECLFPVFLYWNQGKGNQAAGFLFEKMKEAFLHT